MALQRSGKVRLAAIKYRKILDRYPDNADALHNLGMLTAGAGQMAEAAALLVRAVAARPEEAGFSYNLGNVLMAAGRLGEAEESFRRAIATRPDYAEAHVHLANCVIERGRPDEAVDLARHAVGLNAALAPGWLTLGNAYWRLGDYENAAESFRKAIGARQDYAEAYSNLGTLYRRMNRPEDAMACLKKAIALAPSLDFEAVGNAMNLALYMCAWDDLDSLAQNVAKGSGPQKKALTPFTQIARSDDPAEALAVAKRWFGAVGVGGTPLWRSHTGERTSDGPITVGYLSSDFRDHPVGRLIAPLLALHDRERFRVLAFSHGADDGSDPRRRIEQNADGFFDLRDLDDQAAATRIAAEKVDVLVDLNGLTWNHRIGIAALRPAPVQTVYLGFAGTTGAPCFDYIITDPMVSPVDDAAYYSEALAHMPDSFMPSGEYDPPAPGGGKADHHLPEEGVVFCSFNQPYKIDRAMFAVWAEILAEVEGSVLWLPESAPLVMRNLREAMAGAGIDPDRLVFAPRVPTHEEHLARLHLADIALDTHIYNGHATSVDLLWAGVPLVTVRGRHFASRVSSSLLAAAGMPDLVADSFTDYKALAVRMASDPAIRSAAKERLFAGRATAPFFDSRKTAQALEDLYARMHILSCAGGSPRHIAAA